MKPKPLISENPGKPQDVQFAHFGVLNDGAQSKASTVTSLVVNLLLAFVIIVVGAAAKKTIDKRNRLTELTEPIPIAKKVEPIKPKILPPKPKLPEVPKLVVDTPKIIAPLIKPPDIPKPIEVKMEAPKPILAPAPPKQVVAMAAPKAVDLSHPSPPALVNNSAHPTAVALGSPNNPLAPPTTSGPARVDLGNRGVAGMPSSNTGMGRPTTVNLAGSGSPGGSNHGTAVQAVQGIKLGVAGGTGPTTGHAGQVNLGQVTPPPMPKPAGPTSVVQRTAPKVVYKPKPEYTQEAIQAHVEGVVTLHIKVLTNGTVEVVGVTNGLGHGLDESAKRAIMSTRFEPATDATGHPIEWDGVVNVAFQLAG
ncbi:MAG: TonB family protein [Acidobacteriaceae bacterium]|jgi:TonB family protein